MVESKNVSLRGKNILGLEYFSADEIELVLQTAVEMKNIIHRDIKKVPALRGKAVVNLFYEPSTRTRTSFELAGKYLGADVINITAGSSSIVKGESLRDTLYTIEDMGVDAIVMRHKAEGAAEYAAKIVKPVIVLPGTYIQILRFIGFFPVNVIWIFSRKRSTVQRANLSCYSPM